MRASLRTSIKEKGYSMIERKGEWKQNNNKLKNSSHATTTTTITTTLDNNRE